MRRSHLLLATAMSFCVPALVSAAAQAPALLSLLDSKNKQIDDAFIKGDPAPIRDLFSPSATITNPAGGFVGPEDLFGLMKSGTLKYTSNQMSEEKLQQFGAMAILTYLSNDVGTMQGHDISGKSRWTEVWVQQSGQWRIVAVQGTNVIPQGPQ